MLTMHSAHVPLQMVRGSGIGEWLFIVDPRKRMGDAPKQRCAMTMSSSWTVDLQIEARRWIHKNQVKPFPRHCARNTCVSLGVRCLTSQMNRASHATSSTLHYSQLSQCVLGKTRCLPTPAHCALVTRVFHCSIS